MKIPVIQSVELGEPWRLNDRSQGVAVPILLSGKPQKRGYKLLDEVKDKVVLKDTGSIDNLLVDNKSDESVFVRKGTMLKGNTQHRAVQMSIVAEPESTTTVPIRCIYASKGIRGGATFTAVTSSYVPRTVEKSLRRSQSETWNSASIYAASLSSNHISSDYIRSGSIDLNYIDTAGVSYDNLTDNVEKSTKVIDDALKNVPGDHVKQIGIVVVGPRGVEGLEMFDSPDSWSAMSKGVVRNYADILTNVIPDIFEINMAKVKEYVFDFLSKLQNVEGKESFTSANATTYEFQTDRIEGEFTIFDDDLIHILANAVEKSEPTKEKPSRGETVFAPTITVNDWTDRTSSGNTWHPSYDPKNSFTFSVGVADVDDDNLKKNSNTVNFLTKKRGYETLSSIEDEPKTFTEIQNSTRMSSKTVNEGLKEGETLGLVERTIKDGSVAYKLTTSGYRTNPKKFKKAFQ